MHFNQKFDNSPLTCGIPYVSLNKLISNAISFILCILFIPEQRRFDCIRVFNYHADSSRLSDPLRYVKNHTSILINISERDIYFPGCSQVMQRVCERLAEDRMEKKGKRRTANGINIQMRIVNSRVECMI